MNEEEFFMLMMVMFGCGAVGYWVGKARAAKHYLEHLNDSLGARVRPDERGGEEVELARLRTAVEGISHRFDLMEQRVDFTERLVETVQRKAIARSEEDWAKGR
jgi:hypothetical protein